MKKYIDLYLSEASRISLALDAGQIEAMLRILVDVRSSHGRLFFLGVGGGAGNCAHAVNDFRKIAGIESYAPTDNVSELTARINDDGWESSFANWLAVSRISNKDAVCVFSVGGGDLEKKISVNIINAVKFAKANGAKVLGVVGRDGGYTAAMADACVIVPTMSPETITPHTESFQAVVWHLIVSHPALRTNQMKWESVSGINT